MKFIEPVSRIPRLTTCAATLLLWFVAGNMTARPARAADQKLILSDGSDQLVRSYEILGNRVRYFSAERMDWEEIPADMVDWRATEAAKRAAELAVEEARAKAAEIKPRIVLDAVGASPRLLMPEQEGVYVLSSLTTESSRRAGLTRLNQAQATIENDKKRSLLSMISPVPIVKGKATMLLPGKQSQKRIPQTASAIYIMLTPAEPQGEMASPANKPADKSANQSSGSKPAEQKSGSGGVKQTPPPSGASAFSLVRLRGKGNERVVGEITFSPLGGAMKESRDLIPSGFEMAFPAQVDADGDSLPVVWKLTPKTPLEAGEYAVVEFVEHEQQNLFVWDFGVGGVAGAAGAATGKK